MARKRYNPEEIVAKLRQVDVLVSQGQGMTEAIRQIGVSEVWRREGLKVPNKQPKRGRLWLADGSCIRLSPQPLDPRAQRAVGPRTGANACTRFRKCGRGRQTAQQIIRSRAGTFATARVCSPEEC